MDYLANPRNSLESEVVLGQLLDIEHFLTAISESGSLELFSDLYQLAMLRAFKCLELLAWSLRLLYLACHCERKQDFDELKLTADISENVAHHISRLACIYMEAARLIANRYIPGQNNLVNKRLDSFVSNMFLDPGSRYLINGGAPTDNTFTRYLQSHDPQPPLQTLAVVETELLKEIGVGETFPVMTLSKSA